MRPAFLFPLFAPITSLKGVGPRMASLYTKLCGEKIVDLLWHLPVGVIDRTYSPSLSHAEKGRVATLTLRVLEHQPPSKRGKPYRIFTTDGSADMTLTYFTSKGDYLSKLYPIDRPVIVSGVLERFGRGWSMSHPDYAVPTEKRDEIPKFEAVYPLTEGLSRKMVGKTVRQALTRLPEMPEWNDPPLMRREHWPSWKKAILAAHDPATEEQTKDGPDRRRLAYDELLADQLALAVIRRHHRQAGGRAIKGTGVLQKKLLSSLPFKLTKGQESSIKEIGADMEAPRRMLRLLQGDVGSGKTIVALMAILQALEAGYQTALMAPTEILAKQHAQTLEAFLKPLNLKVGLLVGKMKAKEKQSVLASLADGKLRIIVGTHALFQKDIAFAKLGLTVVDEQHRFGVLQRLQLSDKGNGADILVMTATPIPRTLTLTAYGDMDVSRLTEKPTGRQPIDTRLIDMGRLDDVIDGIGRQLAKGAQIYWVCPLVEESEKSDLAAATQRADLLGKRFGLEKVGLVHGQLKTEAKDCAMEAFVSGQTRLLVATTVIEVGVDVQAASLMVIEHAERFGLAQLHQLRGRIGRGQNQSTCLLLYQGPLGEMAKARLTMMRETEDGFRIAEEDLRLRGPGEILGTRQSGLPIFRLADMVRDKDLLSIAHSDAKLILHNDPHLKSERGEALRALLYLFEKDAAVPMLRA